MTPPRIRPFDFAPVQRELERRFDVMDCWDAQGHPFRIEAGDANRASELLGVSRKLIGCWRNGQGLTDVDADHCAIALGLHPVDLWPDYFEICEDIERQLQERAADAHQRAVDKRRSKRTVVAA